MLRLLESAELIRRYSAVWAFLPLGVVVLRSVGQILALAIAVLQSVGQILALAVAVSLEALVFPVPAVAVFLLPFSRFS